MWVGNPARIVAGLSTPRLLFVVLIGGEGKSCDWTDTRGTQVAETPDKATEADKRPEAAQPGTSRRVPVIVVSLSALAVIGAATANALPNFHHFSLPSFHSVSLPNFNGFSLPHGFSLPSFDRFAAPSPQETASIRIPEPPVSATLKDIQSSQQQNAAVLVSLTQSSATQQADLKRISRQLSALATQVDTLHSAMTPLTTSSIPHPNPRTRILGTSRRIVSPLPKPVGPVSVGGAPLSPAPTPGLGQDNVRSRVSNL
jgi:hypothetical protein